MPNWANTNIIFFSNNEKQLQELYSVIFYRAPNAYEEDIKPLLNSNSIGSGWLGAILYELKEINLEQIDKDNIPTDLHCRGWVAFGVDSELVLEKIPNPYLQKDKPSWRFEILTYDAWEPNMKMWDYIIKKHFPDVKFVYRSEEGGNGFYVNSDYLHLYFDEEYIVDLTIDFNNCSESIKNIFKPDGSAGTCDYCEYFEYYHFQDFCDFLKRNFRDVGEITTKEDAEKEIKRIIDAFAAEDNSDSWCYINTFDTPEGHYGL